MPNSRNGFPAAAALLGLVLALSPAPAAADSRFLSPFTDIGRNALAIYTGPNAYFHLSALAGSFLIIKAGWDTGVHNYFVRNPFMDSISRPAVTVGNILPVALGGSLYAAGLIAGHSELAAAGSAVLQSALLAFCTTVSIKALTGRPGPDPYVYSDNAASNYFRFGFLRGGVFHGWPSGHMMVNTAAVTGLLSFYKDKTLLNIAGGAYLGYLFLSVISHGHASMHWFSDAVAGTLMGYAIGTTVGSDFRRRFEGRPEKAAGFSVTAAPQLFALNLSLKI